MTAELKRWWQDRTPRERALLSAMFVSLALILGWLLLVRPLTNGLAEARARHDVAVVRLAEIRAQAAAIRRLESRRPSVVAEPLDGLVSRSANEAGFQPSTVAMEAQDRVAFAISAVRPQALFAWLGRMEARGLVVHRFTATANPDSTIGVQATLRVRGG